MPSKKKSPIGFVFLLLLGAVALAAVLTILALIFPGHFLKLGVFSRLDNEAPLILVLNQPDGLGSDTNKIIFKVTDSRPGLDEIIVRLWQRDQSKDLYRKNFHKEPAVVKEESVNLDVNAKELGLREGDATVIITAFDRSLRNNRGEQSLPFKVSYGKPRVEVLTAQHNGALGGVQLAFYRVWNKTPAWSGVEVGKYAFSGYKASYLDRAFEANPDVYFAFFAFPADSEGAADKVRVVAKDEVGNGANASMYYTVRKRGFTKPRIKLSEDFLRTKVRELMPGYQALYTEKFGKAPAINVTPDSEDQWLTAFKVINEDYRRLLEEKLKAMLSKSLTERLWQGTFNRLSGAAPRSSFGEEREYVYNDRVISHSNHDGIDLASYANSLVGAFNAGRVAFADDLGIYGKTVVLDHGFGLASLYGHLSSISVSVGEMLKAGDVLGRTGSTGLAGGDHLHFEMRLQGIPITPIEWWDERWLRDHIEKRIEEMKRQWGAAPVE